MKITEILGIDILQIGFGGRANIKSCDDPNFTSWQLALSVDQNWKVWVEERGPFCRVMSSCQQFFKSSPILIWLLWLYKCICQEWSSVFHQRTVPKKISRRTSLMRPFLKKRLVFCSLHMWSKSCKACIAQQHTAHYQVFFNLNMKMDAEMSWQSFWWLTSKCLTFLSHCLLLSGHHNLQKEKNQNQKEFGWSTSTAHIFCKGWLARAACQLVVVTQKSWFLAALRDLLPTMT